jgi:hypothetical protein
MVPAKATSVPAQQVPNACASPLDKFATSYVTTVAQTERSSKEQQAFIQTFSALSTLVASNNKCASAQDLYAVIIPGRRCWNSFYLLAWLPVDTYYLRGVVQRFWDDANTLFFSEYLIYSCRSN